MHRKKTEYFRENGSSKRMSVQTDCEMLSVQAMEAYARKYHVSGNDVVELFHENQVFEKMMIQHEYLHQISFEEVLEYVEKIIMEDSKEWGYRLSLREKKKKYFVYEYLFEENSVLNVKRFDALSEEWLEFIKENRSKGGLQHNYDVVIGPVADDNTMETVQLYIANILTSSEAVERLRYNKVNNQVSFHTEKALQYLQLMRRTSYARNDL